MVEKENRIDQLFNSGLKDYSPVTPSSGVWRGIRLELFLHWLKKRRAILLIILLLISLSVIADLTLLNYTLGGKEALKISQAHRLNRSSFKSNKLLQDKLNLNLNSVNNYQNSISNNTSNQSKNIFSKEEKSIISSVPVRDNELPNVISQNEINGSIEQKNNTSGNNTKEKSISNDMGIESGSKALDVENNSEQTYLQLVGVNENNNPLATADSQKTNNDIAVATLKGNPNDANINSNQENNEMAENTVEQKDLKKFPFLLEIYAGPAYSWNSIKAMNTDAEDYTSIRSKQEKGILTYAAGVDLGYTFHNFFVQTGIGLTKYGENANYNWNHISGIDTSNSYGYINMITYPDPNNPNNTIIEFDSVWVHMDDTSTTNFLEKKANHYTYIDIPLMLGYNFTFKRMSARVSAGVSLGFLTNTNGKIPSNDLSGFNDINTDMVKKTVLNCIFRVGFTYSLSRYISVFAEPELKFTPTSIYRGDLPVNVKYYNTSLHLGINYHF
jgi:hypothetical protein